MEKTLKIFILLSLPIFFWGVLLLLPTFDDWTYITSPYFGDFLSADRLLPTGTYWRPFDATIGYIVGQNTSLFPTFNHIVIFAGHLVSTYLIYLLSRKNLIATLFFYLSTAVLGSVLDIDSANQVYAQMWGLLGMLCYEREKKLLWISCVVIATLAKENGIVFCVIPIIKDWCSQNTWKIRYQHIKDGTLAFLFVVAYGIIRIMLTPVDASVNSEYLESSILDHLKDFVQLFAYIFIPIDYVAVVYPPTQYYILAGITLFLAIPFLCMLTKEAWRKRHKKMLWAFIAMFLISASPHLLTLLSIMHCYSALGMASLLIAYLLPKPSRRHYLCFILFLSAALISAVHHGFEAYKSGMVGKEMAQSALRQTKGIPQKVFVIDIDNNEQKYSMFCVIPRDAFGWGLAACHESGYSIANELTDTLIGPFEHDSVKEATVREVIKSSKNAYDAIWLVEGKSVKVVK